MKVVWKFPFEVAAWSAIDMPKGARILCVQMQNSHPQLWALVDPSQPTERRRFVMLGTGHEHTGGEYVDTFQLAGGAIVFHVFEDKRP